jgi:hypothetical protein
MFSIIAFLCSKKYPPTTSPPPSPAESHLYSPFEILSKTPFPADKYEDGRWATNAQRLHHPHAFDESSEVSPEEPRILTVRTAPAAPMKRERPFDIYDDLPTRRDLLFDFDDV